MKSPIDEKVEKVGKVVTTSKTILSLVNAILYMFLFAGVAGILYLLSEISSAGDRKAYIVSPLLLTVGGIIVVCFLIKGNTQKLKVLRENEKNGAQQKR